MKKKMRSLVLLISFGIWVTIMSLLVVGSYEAIENSESVIKPHTLPIIIKVEPISMEELWIW